jgi:2,3-bisphosphoglycerate-independent phosphoglycerate mutase
VSILFLFLDGVGLGENDPLINPLAKARMPVLERLLGGQKLVAPAAPQRNGRASLLALDASLGVRGLPQSATGQAVLLTGRNIPAELGYHYGPKPNRAITSLIEQGTFFTRLLTAGRSVGLLNAYPEGYFEGVSSGRRLYSAFPLAATQAGLTLSTAADLDQGRALSADFTGQAWRDHLGYTNSPLLTPQEAGLALARLAQQFDFSFFEYWLSDYAGHRQDFPWAVSQMESLDGVLEGLFSAWDFERDLLLITSDHGNLEDLSTRRHTPNPVPAVLVGSPTLRRVFTENLTDLTGIAPAIGAAAGRG